MAQPSNPPDDTREPDGRGEEMRAWMVRYGPALRRYFEKRVGRAEAEDLVQDVFVAMQVRGSLDEPEKVDRYLFRVAAHMLARRRQRGGWNWSAHAELADEDAPPDELSPERILIANERLSRLMTALNALPPRMAEAFVAPDEPVLTLPDRVPPPAYSPHPSFRSSPQSTEYSEPSS